MKRRIAILAIATALLSVILAQAAFAGGQTYVNKRRVIKAGVLVCNTATGYATPTSPYVFYIMGQRDDIKPRGWTFVNPLAGGGEAFKNRQEYWLVPLRQTTVENLSKFDILYLSTNTAVVLNAGDRDKLRRYVDGGGCIWVDDGGGMTFAGSGFFLPGINFNSTGGSGDYLITQKLHPLITNPYWLNPMEVYSLGMNSSTIVPGYETNLPSPTALAPIVISTGLSKSAPVIAAIEYGSGRVVFTAGGIGKKLQGTATKWSSPAMLDISNFNLTMAAPSNLRFAYNVVSYATTSTVFRKDPRRSGASIDGLGAPLVNSWTYNSTTWTGGSESVENSPVIWKNIVFVTSGERLVAFDATPQRDLDMNGLPDDGQTDTGLGYDIIWEFKCGILSSPTVATMVDPKDMTPKDFVMVNCSQGHLHIFETLTSDSKGNISGSPVERTNDLWKHNMGPGNGNLLPPVVANGWIYVVGMDAVVYAYCPVLAASTGPVQPSPAGPVVAQVNTSGSWTLPLKGTANPALEPPVVKFGPTLAIVKNQSTGALVQMLSVIAKPTGSSQGRVVNDHIYSLPIYVYSDRLRPISPSTMTNGVGQAMYQTSYTTFPIADYPKTEVWAVDGAGNSIAVTENHNTVASGMVQITATGGVLLGPGTRVYLSYAIDYSKSNISYTPPYYQLEPGITSVTNGIQMPLEATATPAIGANDMFYMGVVWPDARPGGTTGGTGFSSVYAVYYDGNHSSARLDWTYFLHGGGNIPDPTSGTVNAGGSIPLSSADRSRLWGIHARSKNLGSTGPLLPVKHLEVRGTPAVTNDRVFVTATTNDPGDPGMPKGYLLCFKANPEPVIRLNRPLIDRSNPARERPIDVRLWQPDLMFNPAAAGQPPMLAGSVVPSNMLDREAGTITINNFARLRLQGSVPGTPTGTLSLSLPVWVFLDGQPVPLSEIDLSSWDNLLWALPLPPHERSGADPDAPYRDRVVPCSGCSSSPIVLGDYVYFTCDDGHLFAVAVDATPIDLRTRIINYPMPGDSQQVKDKWANTVAMDQKITSLGGSNTARVSPAGGSGLLAVPTSDGLYAFENELTLVTDNRRVMEIASDGSIVWSCDSVYEGKLVAGTGVGSVYGIQPRALNKPLTAQKLSSSDYLVVDSGNDRVIRIDRGGSVMWSLTDFDDSYRNLLRSGETRRLKAPADAITWSEYEEVNGETYFVNHYLVADSGNFRILDIVDRFRTRNNGQIEGPVKPGPDGSPIHELNWVTYTTDKDKRFSYTSIQLIRGLRDDVITQEVWASVANYGLGTSADSTAVASTGGGQLGGAIVAITYRNKPYSSSSPTLEWTYPDDSGTIKAQLTTLNNGAVALAGPTSFTVLNPTMPELLICDQSAVYHTQGPTGNIVRQVTADDYQTRSRKVTNTETQAEADMVVPIPFWPRKAQILPSSGDWLIVNGYAGRMYDDSGSKFTGEVIQWHWLSSSSTSGGINWCSPKLWWQPNPAGPGEFIQKMQNAPNLDQPTSAYRLMY